MEKNVQQIWAAEQFDDNKLKQLLGSTNVGLASNYDVKAADPQLFKQLEFLQYAQKNCQGMSYGDCGTKYTVSHRSAAENILIPAKSKVLDYIVGEKPRSGASYYLAGIGYVATEILFPESGTDVVLTLVTGGAGKGAKLARAEAKAGEEVVHTVESQYKNLTKDLPLSITRDIPVWKGSGPIDGVIGINPTTTSTGVLNNYYPKTGVEYIFDSSTSTFLVRGKNSPAMHSFLADSIKALKDQVVGGILTRNGDGTFKTNEMSGHFHQNWTPELREKFVQTMEKFGIKVQHSEGMK
ncbi:polymorphic toxin type 43 domain-containing protein [Acinetobacter bereziniae]|uniref:Bacterial toxin 43 domain-containing protein n=2 Tax=Acinetobacter bereziniae TaxID=106648 RepID=N8XEQ8_ACIBZ|nr:polymorphic toxin type 43 domain-containing protein [Acinetobacter bereziniae]ENV22957.1 hypothetical protein F963_01210 [Acinetobacter bereziniae NIPH 3]